uniref:polycomb protein Asx-like isoform X1 n=1 Tax=Anopheles coluzzii TaxID=1518534 RepID=UPI0020FFCFC0|nr:polycomb protein Asx-like isoform X1 [Anopheles coluzzii]XP_049463811.1 polycomb protein Asx-like isoform X1 [Anopheles coluzzii]XP_049463812.1 polycomb protein Asx-like isoform X1 [Anopheles coluzzii]
MLRRCTTNSRLLFFLVAALLLLTVPDGARGNGTGEPTGAVRTVMDLMEVMLNRDILDMLQNGGFDFRQPARIFLPPKFYSIVPYDQGHQSPDQILGSSHLAAPPVVTIASGGGAAAGKATQPEQPPSGASVVDKLARAEQGGGSRINLISYSDGKVTTGRGRGGHPAVTNKGSETLEKNVGTNVNGATNFPHSGNRKQTTPANDRQQPSLTTSITDQTVSQNVGRTLPTSGRVGDVGGSSTTDQLRSALPGEPDVDYPILGSVPATQFTCDNRHHGYYADVETRCQVFRVCANTDSTGRGFAFLCPNGTLFNQRHLVCDWYMNVRCEESESLYGVNEAIGRTDSGMGRMLMSGDRQDMMDVVMSMVTYPMRSLMDLMNGVGVIEERVGEPEVQEGEEIGVPPTVEGEQYVTEPETGLEPPFQQGRIQYSPQPVVNQYGGPVGNSFGADVSPPVSDPNGAIGSNVYRPKLDNVYVSSLGTLSTDPGSGFDPQRSTLLTRTEGSVRTVSGVPQADSYGIVNQNQAGFSNPIATNVQLVRADLIKSWNDQQRPVLPHQTPSLKLAPVPRISQQSYKIPKPPRQQHQYQQPHPQTPSAIYRQGSILPPTGVLPPSTLTRTVLIGANNKHGDLPSAHWFAPPVRQVLPIQRVTVVPENTYQQQQQHHQQQQYHQQHHQQHHQHHQQQLHQQQQSHTRPTNFYHPVGTGSGSLLPHSTASQPTTVAQRTVPQVQANLPYTTPVATLQGGPVVHYPYNHPPSHTAVQQVPGAASNRDGSYAAYQQQQHQQQQLLLRRSDNVPTPVPTATNVVPRRRLQTSTVLQVVPALSFYLNDAEEKRAFDAAVRQGLFDERRRSGRAYTSYQVPLGSVGHLGALS